MQFSNIVFAGLLGLATTVSCSDIDSLISQIPSCADTCLSQGAAAANCDSSDYSCQCNNQDTITNNATSCLLSSCSVTDISTTQSVVSEICDDVKSGGSSSSNSSTSSNATSTSSSTSSSASSTGTTGSSAGSRAEFYGLGWVAVAGAVGLMAL